MIFQETKLKGAYVIQLETIEDERGYFARSFCQNEFKNHDLNFTVVQCNISYNTKYGTLRGMHYQVSPHEETKIVYCMLGTIHDVIIDMRPESPTYKHWFGIILSHETRKMVYVPKGFAHGFLSLQDNTMIYYLVSEFYHPECERTIRWDDPAIGIKWVNINKIISKKDSNASYL